MRSPFAPVLLPVIALIAALARWGWQGSGNLYTALEKRFYVADPDLGWRVSSTKPIWIGLEVCAVILAIAIGLGVGGWIVRKLERRRGRTLVALRVLAWAVAAVPLVVPIAAFASGGPPANARESLPAAQSVALETGVSGSLDAPRGTYSVVAHAGTVVTAKLSAGGESFDARFTGVTGTLSFDPRVLESAVRGEIRIPVANIDTGIGERSKHARNAYLLADKYPHIVFSFDELVAARQDTPNIVAFRVRGRLELIGKTHPIDVTGSISKPDATALARLGLDGGVLLVNAQFSIEIRDTALAPDADDFDGARIPIQITLIVRHTGEIES
jgi:polyisoprenoid-binding protein YceI